MTPLLVSVRSAAEAEEALAGGAEYIDVKEPRRGALGFADAETLRDVAATVGDRAVLSAALGEIVDPMPRASFASLKHYRYAKLGLAGAQEISDWPRTWREIMAQLPGNCRPVAVAYADWESCGAPSPAEILARVGAPPRPSVALLIDTFAKNGANLFDAISPHELADLISFARKQKLLTLVAGSLQCANLPAALAASPDLIAVRGVVCQGGRGGKVTASRVAEFRAELARNSHHGCSFDAKQNRDLNLLDNVP